MLETLHICPSLQLIKVGKAHSILMDLRKNKHVFTCSVRCKQSHMSEVWGLYICHWSDAELLFLFLCFSPNTQRFMAAAFYITSACVWNKRSIVRVGRRGQGSRLWSHVWRCARRPRSGTYKSGKENRGPLCARPCISGCGRKSAALISSYDPLRLTAGGAGGAPQKHMPHAQGSLLLCSPSTRFS